MVEEKQEQEPKYEAKSAVKTFRLTPSEDALLPKLMELAYRMGLLVAVDGTPVKSLQAYMVFALNCAYERIEQLYRARRGRG